jgi:RNase H-like domain found in reverse transcriptase
LSFCYQNLTGCQKAFDTIKKRFTEEPVLLMPDQSKPFQIESDASKVATGVVLIQLDSNGDRHPIAFLSKTFSETERKYEIYNRELLGIIRALKEWRHYIQGSGHKTIVYSDHKNLMYFQTAQKLNDQMVVIPVRVQPKAYPLTRNKNGSIRRPLQMTRLWNRRTNGRRRQGCIARKPLYQPVGHRVAETNIEQEELDLDIKNTIETLIEEGPTSLKNDLQDWKIEEIDGQKTIFFKGKNYIPKDLELR